MALNENQEENGAQKHSWNELGQINRHTHTSSQKTLNHNKLLVRRHKHKIRPCCAAWQRSLNIVFLKLNTPKYEQRERVRQQNKRKWWRQEQRNEQDIPIRSSSSA